MNNKQPPPSSSAMHRQQSNNKLTVSTTNGHYKLTTGSNALVMTKTSPLVMADLNCDEDDLSVETPKKQQQQHHHHQPSLIDTNKHEIIKQVHDSMDNLRNELLQKGYHLKKINNINT